MIVRATHAARWLLAATYGLSGLLKLLDPGRFLLDLQAFGFVPYVIAYPTAAVLPWLELLVAAALVCGRMVAGAAAWVASLSLAFALFIGLAMLSGSDAACGCFGDWLVFPNHTSHLLFNLSVAAVAVWVLRATRFLLPFATR
jgi:uncharacterized membrane protein YphA (DoxX/SURF4 family)